jgi:hypothetical protein
VCEVDDVWLELSLLVWLAVCEPELEAVSDDDDVALCVELVLCVLLTLAVDVSVLLTLRVGD